MNAHEQAEQIERYLEGAMLEAEKAAFERQLAEDAALAKEVMLQRRIHEALRDKRGSDFRERLRHIRRERERYSSMSMKKAVYQWGLLAILLAVSIFLIWKFAWPVQSPTPSPPVQPQPKEQQDAPKNPDEPMATTKDEVPTAAMPDPPKNISRERRLALVKEMFNPLSFKPRGDSQQRFTHYGVLAPAIEAFVKEDYNVTMELLERVKKGDKNYLLAQEIAAHACFLKEDFECAIFHFEQATGGLPENMAEQLEGNLLLAYLAADSMDTQRGRTLFSIIKNKPTHPFYTKTLELEEKMKAYSIKTKEPQK